MSRITVMDSLTGSTTQMVIDDTAPPSTNVLYTSMKNPPMATAGKIGAIVGGVLALTPYANHRWVAANTFTVPVSGTWMLWINTGVNLTLNHTATINYKINTQPNVVFQSYSSNAETSNVPVALVAGDKVTFPATATSILPASTYCFEFLF